MKGLKHIMKRFEILMSAAAFAEEGETETARQIMREGMTESRRVTKSAQRDFTTSMAAPSAGRSK